MDEEDNIWGIGEELNSFQCNLESLESNEFNLDSGIRMIQGEHSHGRILKTQI